ARLLSSPEDLPDALNEALFAIDGLACAKGQEELERAIAHAGLAVDFSPDSTSAELALQVWLSDPVLVARTYNRQRFRRLSAFEHFGCSLPAGERRAPTQPTPAIADQLALALDPWFARHHRGQNTTRVELYPLNGEYWFLIRHGDTFSRTPKVDAQRTEILHFRPERDDVVVYSPEHDELRINARTKSERGLYVRQLGVCLHGRDDYFGVSWTYTLEPLRLEGVSALEPNGIAGIDKVVLREVEIAWNANGREVLTRAADDLFQNASDDAGVAGPIPQDGSLCRAAFDFHFADQPQPRPVQIRVPNMIKLGRHCDLQLVDRWLCERGFRR
ncbi:MAG TPA: hypothetical protein VL361_09750, partial [Candidatus Limnocylindrales bacterium]|nr:hypothetical protein [Candidatus Limnocylindrales bacterium]